MFLFFKSDTSKPWYVTLWLTETLSNCYSLLYSFIYFAINDPCYTMQQLNRAVNVITASSLSRRWKYGELVQQWNAVSQKLWWLLEYRRLSFMKLVHSVGQLMQRVKWTLSKWLTFLLWLHICPWTHFLTQKKSTKNFDLNPNVTSTKLLG